MSLTAKADQELTDILMALQPQIGTLTPKAQGFVTDQIARHEKWGSNILLTPAQWKWLRDLYRDTTGEAYEDDGGLEPVDDHMERANRRHPDDDIPF